jgi:hypothetical protein
MSIHELSTGRRTSESKVMATNLNIQYEIHGLGHAILKTRALQALDCSAARFPIYRQVRCAAKRNIEEIFDDLALHSGLDACRLDEGHLLLEAVGVFIEAWASRKTDYSSCSFNIYTDSVVRAVELRERLFHIVGERHARDRMFTIDWQFTNAHGLSSTTFDELVTDEAYDEAYPTLGQPLRDFARRYLAASETVLLLQGPPGTGKTRLVRAILGALSERKGDSAEIMYTGDKKTLENDEIFVEFITGSHDAFVIEDADHMLLARSNGNHDLHRFLAIADGVVRAQGRKIIFTTNLSNINDVDEALLRPGRCFANVMTRALYRDEAAALLGRIEPDESRRDTLLRSLFGAGARGVAVADIYRAVARQN